MFKNCAKIYIIYYIALISLDYLCQKLFHFCNIYNNGDKNSKNRHSCLS